MHYTLIPSEPITTEIATRVLGQCPGCSGELTRVFADTRLPGAFLCRACHGTIALVEEAEVAKLIDMSAWSTLPSAYYFDITYRRTLDGRLERTHGWMDEFHRLTQLG